MVIKIEFLFFVLFYHQMVHAREFNKTQVAG